MLCILLELLPIIFCVLVIHVWLFIHMQLFMHVQLLCLFVSALSCSRIFNWIDPIVYAHWTVYAYCLRYLINRKLTNMGTHEFSLCFSKKIDKIIKVKWEKTSLTVLDLNPLVSTKYHSLSIWLTAVCVTSKFIVSRSNKNAQRGKWNEMGPGGRIVKASSGEAACLTYCPPFLSSTFLSVTRLSEPSSEVQQCSSWG